MENKKEMKNKKSKVIYADSVEIVGIVDVQDSKEIKWHIYQYEYLKKIMKVFEALSDPEIDDRVEIGFKNPENSSDSRVFLIRVKDSDRAIGVAGIDRNVLG